LLDKKIDVTTDEYISLNERRNKHLALICKSRRMVLEDMDFDGSLCSEGAQDAKMGKSFGSWLRFKF